MSQHVIKVDEVMDAIQLRLTQHPQDEYLSSLRRLPTPQRHVWATWVLQCEVENGGFAQYFWNIEPEGFYEEADAGLVALDALSHLELLRKALALIRPHLAMMHTWQGPDDRFTKYKPFLKQTGLYESFSSLNSTFFDLKPSLEDLRERFIQAHGSTFTQA